VKGEVLQTGAGVEEGDERISAWVGAAARLSETWSCAGADVEVADVFVVTFWDRVEKMQKGVQAVQFDCLEEWSGQGSVGGGGNRFAL
jgi:hypothetical protein